MRNKSLSPFGFVLEMLDIPVTLLSYEIHVEQSLISKWKSGSRTLKSDAEHFGRIICFFIKENEKLKLNTLENFFATVYPDEDVNSPYFLQDCLKKFLSAKNISTDAKNLYIQTKKSLYTSSFILYNGNKGRRDAFQMLFNNALRLCDKSEIYIMERENFAWLVNDKEYMNEWTRQMLELLNNGVKVHLVYFIYPNSDKISEFFKACHKVIFNHNLHEYFYHCFNDTDAVYTQYLLKDDMSIVGYTTDNSEVYTSVYTDIGTIKMHEDVIKKIIAKSKLLQKSKSDKELQPILGNIKTFKEREEVTYFSNLVPSFVTMSEELILEILEYNNFSEKDRNKCLELHRSLNDAVFNKNSVNRHFYSVEHLREFAKNEYVKYHSLEVLTNKSITATNEHFKKHLKYIAGLLLENQNFNVVLTSQTESEIVGTTTCWCKEHFWFLSFDNEKMGIVKYCEEHSIVDTLAYVFTDCYNKIPDKYKDNKYVADFLMNI